MKLYAYVPKLFLGRWKGSHLSDGMLLFFSENKAVGVMKPGHCFTIEPMISQGELSKEPTHVLAARKLSVAVFPMNTLLRL